MTLWPYFLSSAVTFYLSLTKTTSTINVDTLAPSKEKGLEVYKWLVEAETENTLGILKNGLLFSKY